MFYPISSISENSISGCHGQKHNHYCYDYVIFTLAKHGLHHSSLICQRLFFTSNKILPHIRCILQSNILFVRFSLKFSSKKPMVINHGFLFNKQPKLSQQGEHHSSGGLLLVALVCNLILLKNLQASQVRGFACYIQVNNAATCSGLVQH